MRFSVTYSESLLSIVKSLSTELYHIPSLKSIYTIRAQIEVAVTAHIEDNCLGLATLPALQRFLHRAPNRVAWLRHGQNPFSFGEA